MPEAKDEEEEERPEPPQAAAPGTAAPGTVAPGSTEELKAAKPTKQDGKPKQAKKARFSFEHDDEEGATILEVGPEEEVPKQKEPGEAAAGEITQEDPMAQETPVVPAPENQVALEVAAENSPETEESHRPAAAAPKQRPSRKGIVGKVGSAVKKKQPGASAAEEDAASSQVQSAVPATGESLHEHEEEEPGGGVRPVVAEPPQEASLLDDSSDWPAFAGTGDPAYTGDGATGLADGDAGGTGSQEPLAPGAESGQVKKRATRGESKKGPTGEQDCGTGGSPVGKPKGKGKPPKAGTVRQTVTASGALAPGLLQAAPSGSTPDIVGAKPGSSSKPVENPGGANAAGTSSSKPEESGGLKKVKRGGSKKQRKTESGADIGAASSTLQPEMENEDEE